MTIRLISGHVLGPVVSLAMTVSEKVALWLRRQLTRSPWKSLRELQASSL